MTGATRSNVSASPALPERQAWFPADTTDGACHYGDIHTSGMVHAVCGAVFVPLSHPYTGNLVWWHKPVDPEHACTRCSA